MLGLVCKADKFSDLAALLQQQGKCNAIPKYHQAILYLFICLHQNKSQLVAACLCGALGGPRFLLERLLISLK